MRLVTKNPFALRGEESDLSACGVSSVSVHQHHEKVEIDLQWGSAVFNMCPLFNPGCLKYELHTFEGSLAL